MYMFLSGWYRDLWYDPWFWSKMKAALFSPLPNIVKYRKVTYGYLTQDLTKNQRDNRIDKVPP